MHRASPDHIFGLWAHHFFFSFRVLVYHAKVKGLIPQVTHREVLEARALIPLLVVFLLCSLPKADGIHKG